MKKTTKVILLLVGFLVFMYVKGHTFVTYDRDHALIGERFFFKQPMILIRNVPASYVSDYIADRYGRFLIRESDYRSMRVHPEGAYMERINCTKPHTLKAVFTEDPIGLFELGSRATFFVVQGDDGHDTVMIGDINEFMSQGSDFAVTGRDCFD